MEPGSAGNNPKYIECTRAQALELAKEIVELLAPGWTIVHVIDLSLAKPVPNDDHGDPSYPGPQLEKRY